MTDDEKTVSDADVMQAAEVADVPTDVDTSGAEDAVPTEETGAETTTRRGVDWTRVLAYGLLPALALILALAAGAFKYVDNSTRDSDRAAVESVQAAKDGTTAMLSYSPDKVEQQLNDARNRLSGDFSAQYTDLINNVVIPGAKQQQITAVATVPAASSISASSDHAVVLVFVNQTVVVGGGAPTDTASSVRITLDKTGGKWLISDFKPV